jgi:acetoacetate decarboxylase
MNDKNPAYSIPRSAPLYPEPPYLYRGGNILICVYQTSRKMLEQLVPEPLKPARNNLVYAWQNEFHASGLGSYHEAVITVPVELDGQPGLYAAYLYLDSDAAIAAGREIYGFPKKFAQFSMSKEGNGFLRSVERGGKKIFGISLRSTKPGKAEDLAALANPIFNFKRIPSIRKGAAPDVMQLTATTLQNVVVHKLLEGNATIQFGRSQDDPVWLLEPEHILKGIYCELDFDLTYGEVVYEYKEEPAMASPVGVVA